jgi:hypothetical protein
MTRRMRTASTALAERQGGINLSPGVHTYIVSEARLREIFGEFIPGYQTSTTKNISFKITPDKEKEGQYVVRVTVS